MYMVKSDLSLFLRFRYEDSDGRVYAMPAADIRELNSTADDSVDTIDSRFQDTGQRV